MASEYRALRDILQKSLDSLDRELNAANLPEFHVSKPQAHPCDDRDYTPSRALVEARRNALASMDMLAALIKEPATALTENALAHWVEVALRLASRTKLIEVLLPHKEDGLPASEIAKQLAMDENKLTKLLRCLAHRFYLREVKEGVFALTRRGILLAPGSPVRSMVAFQTFFSLGYAPKVVDVWLDPARAHSYKSIDTPAAEAYQWESKGSKELWDWLEKYEPDDLQRFSEAMHSMPKNALTEDYDWATIPNDALIVDVGGGTGNVSASILRKFPHYRAIVQDRAENKEAAMKAFREALPSEMVDQERIRFEIIDFFKEQPQKAADVYVMRYIIHDMDDDRATQILSIIKRAMGSASKLLLIDAILEPAVPGEATKEQTELVVSGRGDTETVPFPLLRTTLDGEITLLLDCEMTGAIGGKERTLKETKALLDHVGLKLNRVFITRTRVGVIEVVLP